MKKGITLVSVLIAVAVIFILVTSITISGISTVNNSKKMSLSSEIAMLKNASDSYKIKNDGEYPISDALLLDVSNVSSNSINQFSDETIEDNKILLYQIDYNKISVGDLKYGKLKNGDNDTYVISKKTGKVYYAKGIEIGGVTYFYIQNNSEELLNNDKNITNPAIIFEQSNIKPTNEDVTIKIKVPVNYIVQDVAVENNIITQSTTESTYNIYEYTVSANCTISVKYKITSNDQVIETKYNLTNIDKVPPVLTVQDASQTLTQNSNGENIAFFTFTQKMDANSGLEVVKFVNYKVEKDIDKFFENNGTKVTGDKISIGKGVRVITVYARDKAGNGAVLYVNVLSSIYDALI